MRFISSSFTSISKICQGVYVVIRLVWFSKFCVGVTVLLILFSVDGKVYSWGDGKKGQLGHGVGCVVCQHSPKCSESKPFGTCVRTNTLSHTVTHCHTQTRSVVALQTVRCKRVAAGAYHSVFITGKQLHVNAIHSLIELSNSLGIYNTKKLLTSLITLLL